MTIIAAAKNEKGIWMGCDSQISWGNVTTENESKIIRRGPWLLGMSGNTRAMGLIRYALNLPEMPDGISPAAFWTTTGVNAIRQAFSDGGYLKSDQGRENDSVWLLVAGSGEIFSISGEWEIVQCTTGYDATGSGWQIALGAMHARKSANPKTRVRAAVEAAIAHESGCGGEIHMEYTT